MTKIKKIGVWSLGLYSALAVLIVLLVNTLFTMALTNLAGAYPSLLAVLYSNSALISIIFTIVVVFVALVIVALLYNLIAGKAGGIRIELSEARKR